MYPSVWLWSWKYSIVEIRTYTKLAWMYVNPTYHFGPPRKEKKNPRTDFMVPAQLSFIHLPLQRFFRGFKRKRPVAQGVRTVGWFWVKHFQRTEQPCLSFSVESMLSDHIGERERKYCLWSARIICDHTLQIVLVSFSICRSGLLCRVIVVTAESSFIWLHLLYHWVK